MTKADFENYMKFKKAAEENAAKIEKILNYTVVRSYNPEVIEGTEGKPELITNLIVSQEFPID